MASSGDGHWEHLACTERFGRKFSKSDYVVLKKEDLHQEQYSKCCQAGHCMIYSRYDEKVFGIYNPRAAVMMQMRFDGYMGFPGGLIDPGEDCITGLNRELVEELHLNVEKMAVNCGDYVISHWNNKQNLTLHFYAKEVSMKDFKEIEKGATLAEDFGTEVLGNLRVPLYTMGDGYRGFPAFLSNAFAGNSREQLLQSLIHLNIMSPEEIETALQSKPV